MARKIGDKRWLLERIDIRAVEAMARKQGWTGNDTEGLREYCEPDEAAEYSVHKSLDDATAAALKWLATGRSFYGCAIIDEQVFQEAHDDRGDLIDVPPLWERERTYEVAMDGELIMVEAA